MSTTDTHKNKEKVITARCSGKTKKFLVLLSRAEKLSMSEVVAKSIEEYYKRHFPDKSFFEEEKRLFGRYSSGIGDLSFNRKKYLKEKLRAKHSHS
jgi:hypothetical protein